MAKYVTNSDKILSAVLLNEGLQKYGGYEAWQYPTIESALVSDNPIVHTVAQIISSNIQGGNEATIYREVTDYLKQNL